MRSAVFVPGRHEPTESPNAWDSGRAFWHIGFGLVLGIAVVIVISDGSLSALNRWSSVGLAAALGVNYLLTGRTLILRDDRTVARYPGPVRLVARCGWSPDAAEGLSPT